MNRARMLAAAALLAAGGVAHAQGVHQHEGIFVQLDLGGGVLQAELDEPGASAEFEGGAAQFSAGVGYNVLPGLILGGRFWGAAANEPDFEQNGVEVEADDVTLTLSGVGVDITYYFMPLNLYLQATPSITTLAAERDNVEVETDTGFGMRLAVGKEWWVSDNWALGLNAQFAFSSNDEDVPNGDTWDSRWFGLAFSATYD